MPRRTLVFFLSGVAALVYEAVWARLLTRALGSQAGATAAILATFMAGLGLGALAFAPFARRAARPELCFAGLEAFVAVWACAVPWLLGAIEPVGSVGARAVVAALVLLPPTFAMGATFPTMGRLTIAVAEETGRATSGFYAANTFGAAAGAVLGTAAAMPLFGLRGAGWAAAGVSLAAAAIATTLRAQEPYASSPRSRARVFPLDPFLVVPALFGLASLALEVVMTRLLVTVTGASIYAFAIVLAVFLLGIALGSGQARALVADPARARRALFTCAVGAPLGAIAGAFALRWQLGEPDLFASLGNRMPSGVDPLRMWASHAVMAGLALLAPAVAFGCALPACAAIAVDRERGAASVEATLGRVYAANTLGALLGSLGAGFLALPWLGLRGAFVAALAPCALAAFLVPGRKLAVAAGATAVAAALALGLVRPEQRAGVLFHRAGLYEMVAVEETVEADGRRVRSIRLNGKVEASTAPVDVRLQRLLGHVPALLAGSPRRALCIGTGTGMTAGSLLDFPSLEALDVFEIEPRVPEATAYFDEWNNGLIGHPKVTFHLADGRNLLFRAGERWDLITADPLHVWSKGSSDLYTLEYFSEMARHLAPGGVASQWIGLYELSTRDVQTVLATWCGAFAHARAYLTAYDLALIGSNEPVETDLARVELPEAVALHLSEVGVHSGAEIAALQVADDASLRAFVAGVPPMRDDLPILEFRAPLSFLAGYSEEVLRWCARDEFVERLPPESRARAREVRRLLREFLDALPAGMSAAAARYGRELLALPPLSESHAGR
jgi:spermidine synthase